MVSDDSQCGGRVLVSLHASPRAACERCGAPAVEGVSACVSCGLPTAGLTGPASTTADTTGHCCTFCHSAIGAQARVASCPRCRATHHAECWVVNGGCAQLACTSGAPAPTTVEHVSSVGGRIALPAADAGPRRRAWLVLAISALLLMCAFGGVTLALLSRSDSGSSAGAVVSPVTTPDAATTVTATATPEPTRGERLGDPSVASRGMIRRRIISVLKRHHRAEVDGDWRRAFSLLSTRKQRAKEAVAGRAGDASAGTQVWQGIMGSEVTGLDVDGLAIQDLKIDGRDAALTLSIPKAPGACYAGATWMRFERRRGWTFDPGFESQPNRRGAVQLMTQAEAC